MKKAILGIVGVLTLVVVGAAGFIAMQPGQIEISRTIEVDASPADVAMYAQDLKLINEWSPWRDIDPDLIATYSDGPTDQVGAWYSWNGNDDVGEGKQTITAIEAAKVVHDLHFIRPMEDHATSTISWTGAGEKTTVTWAFHQKAGFGTKAANLVMDIEGMLNGDYDKGLADLKPLVEKQAKKRQMAEAAIKAAEDAAKAAEEAGKAADAAATAAEAAKAAAGL